MNFKILLVGLIILAIGATLAVAVFTQGTDAETGEATPGIIPLTLPNEAFGIPMVGIGAAITLIGVGVVFWGFKAW